MKIGGLKELAQWMRTRPKADLKGKKVVTVGYTAAYAIYVHENMEQKLKGIPRPSGKGVYWGPEGAGPKFLEAPAREMAADLAKLVAKAVAGGMSVEQALLLAGYKLLAESQKRVPTEHGNLRASGFVRADQTA